MHDVLLVVTKIIVTTSISFIILRKWFSANFRLLFMFQIIAKLVKNIHIYTRSFFLCLKKRAKWNYFITKFQSHWKERKKSYQVRQILGRFVPLSSSNFRLKRCEKHLSFQKCQINLALKRSRASQNQTKSWKRKELDNYPRLTLVSMWNRKKKKNRGESLS